MAIAIKAASYYLIFHYNLTAAALLHLTTNHQIKIFNLIILRKFIKFEIIFLILKEF